jgi:hypothetical protein
MMGYLGETGSLLSLELSSIIHRLDVLDEESLGIIALKFEGRGQQVVLSCEYSLSQVDSLGNLEAKEL